jgi:hypothetical protein
MHLRVTSALPRQRVPRRWQGRGKDETGSATSRVERCVSPRDAVDAVGPVELPKASHTYMYPEILALLVNNEEQR